MILLSAFAHAVVAQQAEPDSYAGFEGRKVERVEITARPAMDAESFRPLIRQTQDQALSMEAIRESVAALQQTNEFSQVQVSIEPQVSGLRVIFILQPASYIGISFLKPQSILIYASPRQ
jgi:outer membrane protein assembly factor BamA